MSSVGRDISETLSRLSGSYSIEQFAQIMQIINRRTTPQDEDDALIKHVIYSPLIDLMDTDVTFAESDIEELVDLDHYSGWGMRKFIPDNVRAYDLTHDNSNATGITFPTPGIGQFSSSTIGRKLMGAGQTNGSSYMIIDDHSWWNVTDEIMISGYVYLKANGGSDEMIINKGTDQWELKTISGNTLRFRVEIGATMYNLDYAYTPDTWYQVVAQAKSGTQELWIDNVKEASDTQTGAIGTNSTNVGIFGTAAGGSLLGNGNAISWLSIANGFGDATWISNYFTKNLLDYDTDVAGTPEEITTIPYLGSLQEMPNSFDGMFIGS